MLYTLPGRYCGSVVQWKHIINCSIAGPNLCMGARYNLAFFKTEACKESVI